ncbi:MFS transporter [Burkholderia multivorans]|uniref:MFS transporter n=1 Tax=Burkholderia multivorans TaxID=87883 RepID=UPI001C21CCA8|nr:MFS transporter [Burkholderia multivorans]MBU9477680.1 MFS transporter [Burkholderia multivorans]
MLVKYPSETAPDVALEERILRKVTWRLMPVLIIGLFISYIDRANLGVLFGPLSKDLGLTGSSFGLAAGLFYIGYLLFEIPSNMGMVRFGARIWMARIMVTWGAVTVALAAVQGTTSLYILRILLGVAEAGFFPGVLFYLTLWFPPRALGRSYSILEVCIPVSLAIGSILTSAMLAMHGIGGLAGWRWVFILQGVPAILLGIYIFTVLPDRPGKASWLSIDEKAYLSVQIPDGAQHAAEELRQLPGVLRNPIAWILSFLYFATVIGFWTVTYFLPKIVQERFRVDAIDAGFIAAIPWVAAAVAIVVVSRTSARTGDRRWHMLLLLGVAGAGLFLSAAVSSPYLALIGLCLGAAGMQATVPLFWTMPSSVFRGASAAIAIAMINSLGNTSGLAGPWLLGVVSDLTGSSRVGLYVMSGFFFIAAILAFAMSSVVLRNAEREGGEAAGGALQVH